jgi:tetratricopeptide (TPR) repeat protein
MELVKEGGREWKISDWEEFKMVGHEHLAKAILYCGSQNQNQAIPEYEAALAENPKDALVALMWGICYMQSSNLPAAEKKLKEVIEISPDFSSEAHFTGVNP